jgi:DHA3 family macrolide efflux protein-like MFS transporter
VRQNWQRTITLFLVGQAITLFGTAISGHAITWYVTLQTQSGTILMLFSVATMVPMALSSPIGGVLADRYNRKYLINLVDGAIALVTLVMAIFFSAGFEWLSLLFVCAIMRGLGQGIQMPTVTAIIPDIVPPEQLVRVNGFNSTIQSLSLFASPMLAAALLSFFPIQVLMYLDVVTAVIGIAIVFIFVHTHKGMRRTPAPSLPAAPAGVQPTRTGFLHEFKEGLRYILAHPFALAFIAVAIIFSLLATPVSILTPLQVTRDFGADPWRLGAIEVAFALGMMGGGVLIGIWGGFKNRSYTMALATLAFGLFTAALGILENFWLYLGCMALAGISMPIFNAPSMAVLQARVDADFLGRVSSVFMMVGSLAMPFGMLVFGPVSDIISIDWLLIGTGIAIIPLALAFILHPVIREAGILPEPAPGIDPAELAEGAPGVDPTEGTDPAELAEAAPEASTTASAGPRED